MEHSDQALSHRNQSKRPKMIPSMLLFVAAALLLGIVIGGLIVTVQLDTVKLATDTRDKLLPTVLERQRSAINVERLGRFGEIIYSTSDSRERRATRLAAQVLAQDTAFETDPHLHKNVWEAFEVIRNIAALRDSQEACQTRYDEKLAEAEQAAVQLEKAAGNDPSPTVSQILGKVRTLQMILMRTRTSSSVEELEAFQALFDAVEQEIFLAKSSGGETVQPLWEGIERFQEFSVVFQLRKTLLQYDIDRRESWTEARAMLTELTEPLSTDAGILAANRITSIVANAERAMIAEVVGLGATILILFVLSCCAWRYIAIPILQVTRGLERVESERVAIQLPPMHLRELEAIRNAAERFGSALLQVAEHAQNLEAINKTLATEVAERRRAETELARAKEVAETADHAKSEFLASMSHEIRTPLTAILGMADLLWESPLTADQRQYVQIFRSAGENLLNIINDILDLSKVEAGHVELESIGFNLNELIDRTCQVLAIRAHEKGLEISSQVLSDAPANLMGDPTRLRQILFNLIGNAVKFTEEGEVAVRVERDMESPEPGSLLFSVRDTGIGVPPEKKDQIFEVFAQVDSSTTRKYGGTGLGLTISKRLVEMMGGRLWVVSEPGQGSTFFFTASFQVLPEPHISPSLSSVNLQGIKALVVDDNLTNLIILREHLTSWGAKVTLADSGEQALNELKGAHESGEPFRLVLLDCRMPGMDGLEVAEHIKANPATEPPVVMMLTSDDRGAHRNRVREIGLAAYLVKPVSRQELLEAVSSALGKPGSFPHGSIQPEAVLSHDDFPPMNILLAEDNASNRRIVEFYLQGFPFQVTAAQNGKEALEKYSSGAFDLVLMDMRMPVMDGYAASRAIRDWEKERSGPPRPIIALTAHAFKEDKQKCLDAGCTEYLTKPIRKDELIRTIHKFAGTIEADASPDLAQEPARYEKDAESSAADSRAQLYGQVRIKADLEGLIPFFMEDSFTELSTMRTALEQGDFDTVQRVAHGIKGSSKSYGFDALGEIGQTLETKAEAHDADEIAKILAVLADYLERVQIEYI